MHIKLTNGVPEKYTIGQLRRDNPQVSFPKNIPDATLAEYDVYPLTATDRPQVDYTKNVTEDTQILVEGVWTQVWSITEATADEIAERTLRQEAKVRMTRTQMLDDTDWIIIKAAESGTPVPTEWQTYRQALRDVTTQPGFPHEVVWPTMPE
jgi:hypothetical protein